MAYCHSGNVAQPTGSCTRAVSEKGGTGQLLTLAVSTAPELQAGTLAAKGAVASGPAACWLAGLTSAPAAAAPSVPRLTTVPPASPNVYQSSGARQLLELLEGAAETVRDTDTVLVPARERVAVTVPVVDGEALGAAVGLAVFDRAADKDAEDESDIERDRSCDGVGEQSAASKGPADAYAGAPPVADRTTPLGELSNRKAPGLATESRNTVCPGTMAAILVPAACMSASGAAGGEKVPVYTATPATMRTLAR